MTMDNQPYAYQAWHCQPCEVSGLGSGSIVESPPSPDGPAMHCETCGTGYDSRGRHVPDPDDE